jgi:hypothetical protein
MQRIVQCPICYNLMKQSDENPKMYECPNCCCKVLNIPNYNIIPPDYLSGHA